MHPVLRALCTHPEINIHAVRPSFTFRVGYSWTLRAIDSWDAVSCTAILVFLAFLWLFVFFR